MNRIEAAKALAGVDSRERLRAARWFARHSEQADYELLRNALDLDNDRWTHAAIHTAIRSLQPSLAIKRDERPPDVAVDAAPRLEADYSTVIEEVASQFVHELEPVLGVLRVVARREIPDFEESQTSLHLDRFERILSAIDMLRRAATPPAMEEIELSDALKRVAEVETSGDLSQVSFAGPRPLLVIADRAMLELAFANGIRNALESSAALEGETPPIIITWGVTDRDYWVTVLDEGLGVSARRTEPLFEMGATSKRNHVGMGLALARQAATSLGGSVALVARSPKGASFSIRWPITPPP